MSKHLERDLENLQHDLLTLAASVEEAILPAITPPPKLQRMTDLTASMVRQSLDSFVNLDARLARMVCRLDDEVDRYNREIIQDIIQTMRAAPDYVEPGLSLFSAIRHLER